MERLSTIEECLKLREEMETERDKARRVLKDITEMQNEIIKHHEDVIYLVDEKIKEINSRGE